MTSTPPPITQDMIGEVGAALPQSHLAYAAQDPEMFAAYLDWRKVILTDGALTRVQKLLAVVSIMVSQKSAGPLRVYASIARSEGATAAELKEALRVGVLFSGGSGIDAAANVADLLVD